MDVVIDNVSFDYVGDDAERTAVLRGVSLRVASGTVHAVIGPSGCGKTTLLRLIGGLERNFRGSIELTGQQRRPRRTAFVFQEPRLVPWWTVGRNIGVGLEFDPVRGVVHRRAKGFFSKLVGLARLEHRRADTLSHGQQARASIGRALAYDADVMLLDEPFAHLDAIATDRLLTEFETHWQLEPRTYVVVTHDIDEAVRMADTVSVMSAAPGTITDTITIDLPRPRSRLDVTLPGYRSAIGRIWEALERASR